MRKFLPALLFLVCLSASAEWIRIGEKTHTTVEKYIDNETVRQSGPMAIMRQVWELDHYSIGEKDKAKSVKILAEYDCKDRRRRVLTELRFSELWATGESLVPSTQHDKGQHTERAWTKIEPQSISEIIIDEICPHDSTDG